MFCGDSSGDWLARALFEAGFANQPTSTRREDGLALKSAYITAIVRCAPPGNQPLPKEVRNCEGYLRAELAILRNAEVVLTLGRMAYEQYVRVAGIRRVAPPFKHGLAFRVPGGPLLVASYHPSRQNTQTGRMGWSMWIEVFREIRRFLDSKEKPLEAFQVR